MSEKQYCMVMKINVDCNACCRKLRRILFKMKAIETHMIERERYRVIVFGRFRPADVAIKIRKKMNRRVEILDVEEMEADQNPPPQDQVQQPPLNQNQNHNNMFPSLEHDIGTGSGTGTGTGRPMFIFPSLAANHNQCRSFSSTRPDFTLTAFPHPENFGDMPDCFPYYDYGYQFAGHPDSVFSHHNYY